MSKQINLLLPEKIAPGLSARRLAIGLGVLFAAFLGYGAYAWLGTSRLGDNVEQGGADLIAAKAARQALEQKLGERPKMADLVAEIEALKPLASESQDIMALLGGGGPGTTGYSAHLAALATVSEEGVWLTGVTITKAGKGMSLTGRSLNNDSVLRYAQRVNARLSGFGVQFSAVELSPEGTTAVGPGAALSTIAFKLF
jgi:hypothetical protein